MTTTADTEKLEQEADVHHAGKVQDVEDKATYQVSLRWEKGKECVLTRQISQARAGVCPDGAVLGTG